MRSNAITNAVLAIALAGCADPSAEVGVVEMALVTTGSDGAQYRLPPESWLTLSNPGYWDARSLDGDDASISIEAPTGDYLASLQNNAQYTDEWPLERVTGGVSETVFARLVTPMPANVTIVEGAPANLALTFRVATGGSVTFSHGELAVDVAVEEVAATGATVALGGSLVASEPFIGGGPADLASRLPAAGAVEGLDIEGSVAGPWTQVSPTRTCAPFALGVVTRSGSTGFSALVTESLSEVRLCVEGQFVSITARRYGPATTPTFEGLAAELYFGLDYMAVLPQAPFDGHTLDLDLLAGSRAAPLFLFVSMGDASVGGSWYSASFQADGHVDVRLE